MYTTNIDERWSISKRFEKTLWRCKSCCQIYAVLYQFKNRCLLAIANYPYSRCLSRPYEVPTDRFIHPINPHRRIVNHAKIQHRACSSHVHNIKIVHSCSISTFYVDVDILCLQRTVHFNCPRKDCNALRTPLSNRLKLIKLLHGTQCCCFTPTHWRKKNLAKIELLQQRAA